MKISTSLTLEEYVSEIFRTDEKLSFETYVKKYAEGECTIQAGMVERNIYFMRSGIIQASVNSLNGDENIFGFGFSGGLFCSLSSFITQQPTDFTYTCLADCVFDVIPRDSFYRSLDTSILSNKFYRHLYDIHYLSIISHTKDLRTLKAADRYVKMLETQPELVKYFSAEKIARYLGIHRGSLSRLRK